MRKVQIFLASGLFLLSLVLSTLVPQSAAAQQDTIAGDLLRQARAFTSLKAIERCLGAAKLSEDITNLSNSVPIFEQRGINVGHHLQPNDPGEDCSRGEWVSDALDYVGISNREFMSLFYDNTGGSDVHWTLKDAYRTEVMGGDLDGDGDTDPISGQYTRDATKMRDRLYEYVEAEGWEGYDIDCSGSGRCSYELSDPAKYALLYKNLIEGCEGDQINRASDNTDSDNRRVVTIFQEDIMDTGALFEVNDLNRQISLGIGFENDVTKTCSQIISRMNELAPSVEAYIRAHPDQLPGSFENDGNGLGGAAGGGDETSPQCVSSGFELGWIICPLVTGLANLTDAVYKTFIYPMLTVTSSGFTNSDEGIYKAWSGFRSIANVLLIIFLLVAVFGQSIGGGLIDAYTAKKILPRLLLSVILINLSIYLVTLAVDVTNIIGKGLTNLLYAPFGANNNFVLELNGALEAAGTAAGIGGLVLGLTAGGSVLSFAAGTIPFILLFLLLPAALAFIGVMVTLILRRGILIFLILVSPIAFALYCLPNTEQYFKKWWSLFSKTLLVYPIIMVVFAMSDVLASIVSTTNGSGGTDMVADLTAIVLLVLPMFLIPWAFKLAGGAIGGLYGVLAGFNKRGVEGIKGNPNDANSMRNRSKRQMGEKFARSQAQVAHAGRDKDANLFRRTMGRFADVGNVDQRLSTYNRLAAERREALSSSGNDDLIYAGIGWQGTDGNYYNAKGKPISAQEYRKGKSLYGNGQHDIGQALSYTLSKAQTDNDVANFRYAYAQAAQRENWTNDEAMGVWAAATYPHKGSMSSEWYSKPVVGSNGSVSFKDISNNEGSYGAFIGDLHKSRESYKLGSLRDQDWRAMYERQETLQQKLVSGQDLSETEKTQLAQTYEVFDASSHRMQQMRGEDGQVASDQSDVSASGTAASQPIIRMAMDSRKKAGVSVNQISASDRGITVANGQTPGFSVRASNVTGDANRSNINSGGFFPS